MVMRGRTKTMWWGVVLDAKDPIRLAEFYADVLGWPISHRSDHGAGIGVPDTVSYVGFQRNDDYEPPTWPGGTGAPQMMLHLDVAVDDLDAALDDALSLGATLATHQPQADVRVLLDPEGHPFCLYVDSDL
jgi:predicted enzyme related to lactoylglutathione lyase